MKNLLIPILLLNIFAISCSNRDTIELKDNVHLKKSGTEKFELIFDKGTDEEWTYENVDSLAISEYYGFLFYGMIENGKEKKWFFVTGAPLEFKKGFGNWYDSEFRKYRLKELHNGLQLYEGLKSTEQIWNEIN